MENNQILNSYAKAWGHKMKNLIIVFIFNLLFLTSCYAARIDGPYEGRIIDADTDQPIEGVIVLGVWYTETPSAAGALHRFYDAMETVTDKNGEFKIKGLGLKVLSNVIPMDVLIFKAGYEHFGLGPWTGLKSKGWKGKETSYDPVLKTKVTKPVFDSKEKVKWEGDKAIIPLKKLTMEERKKQGSPDFSSQIPGEKMKRMLDEINKERAERGLDPYRLGGSR